jgi:hypothetical protein
VCEKRVDKTTLRAPTRRLDGYKLYTATDFKFDKLVMAKFDAEHASSERPTRHPLAQAGSSRHSCSSSKMR